MLWNQRIQSSHHPTNRARHALTAQYEETDGDETYRMAAYGSSYGRQRNDDMRFSDAIWWHATEDKRETLRQLRDRVKKRIQSKPDGSPIPMDANTTPTAQSTSQHHSATQEPRVGQMRQQVAVPESAINHTNTLYDENESTSSDDDSAVANLEARDTRFQALSTQQSDRHSKMVSTEQVHCHIEYLDRLANLSHSQAPAYATADSGADTNVLGHEWLIVDIDPVRKINLIGFDAAHAQKKAFPLLLRILLHERLMERKLLS